MKNLEWLNMALLMKSMWMEINGSGLWNMVMEEKYLRKLISYGELDKERGTFSSKFFDYLEWFHESSWMDLQVYVLEG